MTNPEYNDKLIESSAYTPEIVSFIDQIKNRMIMTGVKYTDDDIRVFEHGENIYILANPILGVEPIFDESGKFKEMIPMRNLTVIRSGLYKEITQIDGNIISVPIPRIRILRPDLCTRISKTADLAEDQ